MWCLGSASRLSIIAPCLASILLICIGSAGQAVDRPNVVMISVDTVRADHLSCYRYRRKTSPGIDALAKGGVLFEEVTAAAPWTVPSHMSMFTGLYPDFHGVMHTNKRLNESIPTLALVLKKHGYTTAGFVSGPSLNNKMGFGRGFGHYDDFSVSLMCDGDLLDTRDADESGINRSETGTLITKLASTWLEKNVTKRFFLFVHYWDPHYDYIPPAPHDRAFDKDYEGKENGRDIAQRRKRIISKDFPDRDLQRIVSLYDGEIRHTDELVGTLLTTVKRLGLDSKTLVILTSDHGEQFKEHGDLTHGKSLYQEEVHVPLVLSWPGKLPPGLRVDGNVSHVDLMPTILGLLELKPPSLVQGIDLTPVCLGKEKPPKRIVFSRQKTSAANLHAARLESFKLMRMTDSRDMRLYDLASDPMERKSLWSSTAQSVVRMRDILRQALNTAEAQAKQWQSTKPSKRSNLDARTIRQLKSLGYLK